MAYTFYFIFLWLEIVFGYVRWSVMSEIVLLEKGSHKWFQLDDAPLHYALWAVPNWNGHCGHMEWAPWFPGMNPLDYCLWGMLKAKMYEVKIRSMDHLKERISEACAQIRNEAALLDHIHNNFAFCIEQCIVNNREQLNTIFKKLSAYLICFI